MRSEIALVACALLLPGGDTRAPAGPRGDTISIGIVDETGLAVAGALVRLSAAGIEGHTGEDGVVTFEAPATLVRDQSVFVHHPAFTSARRWLERTEWDAAGSADHARACVTIVLAPRTRGGALSIRIVDDDGIARAAEVQLVAERSVWYADGPPRLRVPPEGAVVDGLATEDPWTIYAFLGETIVSAVRDIPLEPGVTKDVELVVPRTIDVTLGAVDEEGAPVAGRWTLHALERTRPVMGQLGLSPGRDEPLVFAHDVEARVVASVPPGLYALRFEAPDGRSIDRGSAWLVESRVLVIPLD